MPYTAPTFVNGGAPPLNAANLNAVTQQVQRLSTRAHDVRDYGAVGDGTTDDTAAIQNALNSAPAGATVVIPGGLVFICTGTLTMSRQLTLAGSGELRFTAGITTSAAVAVTATGGTVLGVKITNPNALRSQTGNRNTGITIAAHDVTVRGCLIDTFQNGIIVEANGEWLNILIADNRIKDVTGAGDGPTNSTSTFGEDRGDGIVCWGARATISGNVVNCKAGSDARIGIHAEALAAFEATPNATYSESLVTITGNVVYGQFRRSIALEGIKNGTISGNTVADATWWSLALSDCWGCTVTGNTVMWTRAATDNQGSSWNPPRAPLAFYGDTRNSVISNNAVRVLGNAPRGLVAFGESTTRRPVNCTAVGNTIVVESGGAMTDGIDVVGQAEGLRLIGNRVAGFTANGCYVTTTGVDVIDNHFDGVTSPAGSFGIRTDGGTDTVCSVSGNTIRRVATGVSWVNTTLARINDNTVDTAGIGIELFGTGGCVVTGNLFNAVTTHISNGSGAGVVANNS